MNISRHVGLFLLHKWGKIGSLEVSNKRRQRPLKWTRKSRSGPLDRSRAKHVPSVPKKDSLRQRSLSDSMHAAQRTLRRYDFYRASAGLHQLTGDFFRSSSSVKKTTPGDISATVVPFKKALPQLCVLQLPARVTHSPSIEQAAVGRQRRFKGLRRWTRRN
jgi:hypothetical protein